MRSAIAPSPEDTEGCPECGGEVDGDRWEGRCLECGWFYCDGDW